MSQTTYTKRLSPLVGARARARPQGKEGEGGVVVVGGKGGSKRCRKRGSLGLAADATREADVLGHDGDALGVEGAQVGVLEQANQVGLGSLLQGHQGGALEAHVPRLVRALGDLTHQTLEGLLFDQQVRALLVVADLLKREREQLEA